MGNSFKSSLKEVTNALSDSEEKALIKIGMILQGASKLLTPVDTGTLRDSIEYEVDKQDKSVIYGSTLTSEDYPIFIEKGTSKSKAQPYLEPALENNIDKIEDIVNSIVKGELE